jgi:hypothetical protein
MAMVTRIVRLCCRYGDRAQMRTASFVAIGLALTAEINGDRVQKLSKTAQMKAITRKLQLPE